MKNQLFAISSLIALSVPATLFTIAPSAQAAGSVIGSTATTTMGSVTTTFDISNAVNQSGLSATYTSGTTDFDSYVSTTTANSSSNLWFGNGNTGFVTFDLGASYDVNALALWAVGSANVSAVRGFSLYADTDADTNSLGSLLGNFSAVAAVGGNNTIQSQVFNFATTNTRYIQMNITSNAGGSFSGLNEVAFGGSATAVPWETDALSVIGTTLLFAGGVWKKRKSTKPLDKE
jgi:hypothetical protein